MKEIRNKHGSTLSLVAVCLVVLVILGVAFYYFSRMFGGGREVGDAVDGGTLGIARRASRQIAVNLATLPSTSDVQQFGPLSDPPNSNAINLLTYNRLVGQAILVSINAQAMGNTQAATSAKNVWTSVQAVGQALTAQLNNANTFAGAFNQVSNLSNSSMLGINGSNTVNYNMSQFKTAYMRNGLASNIYIPQDLYNDLSGKDAQGNPDDFASVGATIQNQLKALIVPTVGNNGSQLTFNTASTAFSLSPALTGAPMQASSGGAGYLPGYTNISLLPGSAPAFVPVVPFNPPHLVSKYEFNQQNSASPVVASGLTAVVPPNAFEASGQANQNTANVNNVASSIACAVIGCPTTVVTAGNATSAIQTMAGQYPLQIPGGFIRLENLPGLSPPGGAMVANGANDIFNNELYGYPGITQSNPVDSTGNGVFSTDPNAVPNWANYNSAANAALASAVSAASSSSSTTSSTSSTSSTSTSSTSSAAVSADSTNKADYYPPNSGRLTSTTYNNLAPKYPANISSMYAPGGRDSSGNPVLRYGSTLNQAATLTQLQAVTSPNAPDSSSQCYSPNTYNPVDATSVCSTALTTWEGNYGRGVTTQSAPSGNYNAVEYMKAELLIKNVPWPSKAVVSITPPTQNNGVSGMHLTQMQIPGSATSIGVPMRQPTQSHGMSPLYSVAGTPLELLGQAGNSTTQLTAGTAIYNIYQRCREIKPGVAPEEIVNALSSITLDMGNVMYLYVNPSTGVFQCDSLGPIKFNPTAYVDQNSNSIVDGVVPTANLASSNLSSNPTAQSSLQSSNNLQAYQADGYLVDTQAVAAPASGASAKSTNQSATDYSGAGSGQNYFGEANYHDQPLTETSGIVGMDAAVWTPCSGYHNLLGVVQFQTAVPQPGGGTVGLNGAPPAGLSLNPSGNGFSGGSFSAPN